MPRLNQVPCVFKREEDFDFSLSLLTSSFDDGRIDWSNPQIFEVKSPFECKITKKSTQKDFSKPL